MPLPCVVLSPTMMALLWFCKAPATISDAEALYRETSTIKGPPHESLGLKSNFFRIFPSVLLTWTTGPLDINKPAKLTASLS